MRNDAMRWAGFTLLELSVVLIIIAIIMAGGAVMFTAAVRQHQADETNAKLAMIQKTLWEYRLTFARLPCPADVATYNVSDQYFGREAQNRIGCNGSPASTFNYNITTGSATTCDASQHCIYGGMVPTKTLALPDEYAFDAWGRRFLYAVDSDAAKQDAFNTVLASIASGASTPRIAIAAAGGYVKSDGALYVLVSAGRNGHGAYPRQTVGLTRVSTGSTNAMELTNCHCTTAGANATFDRTFYQARESVTVGDPLDAFDDIVVFATRAALRSPIE